MADDEPLREALLELELLRQREKDRARESTAILSALEAMTSQNDASDGVTALLESIRGTLSCGLVALLDVEQDCLTMRFPTDNGLRWHAPGLVKKPRRIVEMRSALGLWETLPPDFVSWRSLLSVPLHDGVKKMVIVAFSAERAAFTRADADLLTRLTTIAAQAIVQRALEQHSAFVSSVIDASPTSVAIADARDDLPLIYVNSAFTALTGYTAEEVIGKNCRMLSAERAGSEIRTAIRETLENQKDGTFLLRNKAKDGTIFWNDLRLFPIRDASGTVAQYVATQTDATERVEAEEERNRLRRQLDHAQMQERLGQISAGLAHDFNNLLSAILGSATLIQALKDVPAPAVQAADRITVAANSAAELVDGFLDIGLREKRSEPFHLGDALVKTVELARMGAPAQATVQAEICDAPVLIKASRTDVLQTVMNLVVNGLDALDGKRGEVEVALHPPAPVNTEDPFCVGTPVGGQSYAGIVVRDSGAGMSPEVRDKVLEPYFTTKGNEGTGLGLAIVVSTLQANNCLLRLDTAPGKGATFTIFWPVDSTKARPKRPQSKTVKDRRGLPILIIDDQEDVAHAIGVMLSNAGFEVAETCDPEAAIETILEDQDAWGCVISDYDMPAMTGGDVVARLAQDAPDIPVIIVSALARRMTDPRTEAAHAILSKPVQVDALVAALNTAMAADDQAA